MPLRFLRARVVAGIPIIAASSLCDPPTATTSSSNMEKGRPLRTILSTPRPCRRANRPPFGASPAVYRGAGSVPPRVDGAGTCRRVGMTPERGSGTALCIDWSIWHSRHYRMEQGAPPSRLPQPRDLIMARASEGQSAMSAVGASTRECPLRRSRRVWGYIPQTVTGTPAPDGARRNILSAQGRSGARSNTIRWPAFAPRRSI